MKTQTETTKAVVIEVSRKGAMIAFNGQNTLVSWDTLNEAAEQSDRELRNLYASLRKQAVDMMYQQKPTEIRAVESNTNVYGVQGRGLDGHWHHVRLFRCLAMGADEAIDDYTMRDAISEARVIAKRNEITCLS